MGQGDAPTSVSIAKVSLCTPTHLGILPKLPTYLRGGYGGVRVYKGYRCVKVCGGGGGYGGVRVYKGYRCVKVCGGGDMVV